MAPANRKRSLALLDTAAELPDNKRSRRKHVVVHSPNSGDHEAAVQDEDHEFSSVTLSNSDQMDLADSNDIAAEGSPLTVNSRASSVDATQRPDSGVGLTPDESNGPVVTNGANFSTGDAAADKLSPVRATAVTSHIANIAADARPDSGGGNDLGKGDDAADKSSPTRPTVVTSHNATKAGNNTAITTPADIQQPSNRRSRYLFLDLPEDERVLRRTLQDPVLDYSGIPPTNPACIEPWTTDKQPMTRPHYSMMPKMLSDSDVYMPVLRAALEFVSYANWVNPSRIDVNHYMAAAVDNKNSYMTRVDDPKHSVVSCVIPAIISGSNITTRIRKTSANNNVYYFKRIYAVAFRQEYELMVGKLGMIFRFDSISGDYIPPQTGFVTRPAWPARDSNRGKFGGKKSKLNLLRAASTGAKSNVEDESDLGLTGDDIVPVYDARYVPDFRLDKYLTDLSVLPPFDGEIPLSATALIAFNPVVYQNGNSKNIKFYLLWAVVIDHSPLEDEDDN